MFHWFPEFALCQLFSGITFGCEFHDAVTIAAMVATTVVTCVVLGWSQVEVSREVCLFDVDRIFVHKWAGWVGCLLSSGCDN